MLLDFSFVPSSTFVSSLSGSLRLGRFYGYNVYMYVYPKEIIGPRILEGGGLMVMKNLE